MSDQSTLTTYDGRPGLVQRVLSAYRAPVFDAIAERCPKGLSVFAGTPRENERITVAKELHVATHAPAANTHLFKGAFEMVRLGNILPWLRELDPDVLITEANPRYIGVRSARSWMQKRDRPVIGWGLGTLQLAPGLQGIRARARNRYISGFDGLIAYSTRAAREYEGIGFDPDRIFVARNACTMRPTWPLPDRPDNYEGAPRLLYVGRINEGKRLGNLIRAAATLQREGDVQLDIVGDGPTLESSRSLAEDIDCRATFHGALYGDDLNAMFDNADLFVLPGLGGLAIQQAMAHGLPVIVAEGDGTQDDLITEGTGWNVTPGDIDALTDLIRAAVADVGRLRAMGAEAYRLVVEEINIEAMAETFIRAMNTVTGAS